MAFVALVLLSACNRNRGEIPQLPVSTAVAAPAQFTKGVDTVSTLEALELVELAAQAGGRINKLMVSQGDFVKEGQLLVVLDQEQIRAEVAELQAKSDLDKLNWQRYEFLFKEGAVSEKRRDEYKVMYEVSRERLKSQKATLTYSNLRSPISGTVSDVQVKIGDVIQQGDPFTKIVKNNVLVARVEIPATFSQQISLGLPVILSQPGSTNILATGQVNSIDPTVSPDSQGLLVKAAFPNTKGELLNGQRLRTRLQLSERQVTSVPFAAVTQTSGQSFVWRLGTFDQLKAQPGKADMERLNKAKQFDMIPPTARFALQTPVSVGNIENNRYPVTKGLESGQEVITSNLLNLKHGMPVKVKN